MEKYLNRSISQVELSGIRRFSQHAKTVRPNHVSLTVGDPSFATPEAVKQAAIASINQDHTHYPPGEGINALRKAIAAYENGFYGTDYKPEEVVITTGATGGLAATFFSILEAGDEVIVPAPYYALYKPIIEVTGGVIRTIDTAPDGFQLDETKLRAVLSERTKAILLNSPNNPTGAVYNQESLEVVYQLAKAADLFVIVDEVYNKIIYTEFPTFMQFKDIRDRIILIQSFSKPYAMTGWRIGYTIADQPIADAISKMNQFMTTGITSFIQEACLVALEADYSAMVEEYQVRRDYAYGRLVAMGMDVNLPDGAFYLFPSIQKYQMSSEAFCERALLEQEVALVAGTYFDGEGYIRICYCGSMDNLAEGLDRLERFINSL